MRHLLSRRKAFQVGIGATAAAPTMFKEATATIASRSASIPNGWDVLPDAPKAVKLLMERSDALKLLGRDPTIRKLMYEYLSERWSHNSQDGSLDPDIENKKSFSLVHKHLMQRERNIQRYIELELKDTSVKSPIDLAIGKLMFG